MRAIRNPLVVATAVIVCAWSLLACSSDDGTDSAGTDPASPSVTEAPASDPSDGPQPAGRIVSGQLADGSELVVHLDVTDDHPAVVPFETFRAVTGASEPTWIVAEITVPEGIDGTGRFLTFLEPGADRLEDDLADRSDGVTQAEFACAVMEDWFQGAEVKDQALSDAYMAVYEGPCGGQAHQVLAPGGTTTTYVLVYDGPLPDFDSVEAEMGTALTAA